MNWILQRSRKFRQVSENLLRIEGIIGKCKVGLHHKTCSTKYVEGIKIDDHESSKAGLDRNEIAERKQLLFVTDIKGWFSCRPTSGNIQLPDGTIVS